MTTSELIERLESLGYSYVTFLDSDDKVSHLTAVEPQGNQIEIKISGDTVLDRKAGSKIWDIMFIREESFL